MKATLTRANEIRTVRAYGDEIHVHLGSEVSGGKFTMFTDCTPPQMGPPPHFHTTEDEWWYVLEGKAEFFDGENWIAVAPGGAVFSPMNSLHSFRNVGDTTLKNITSLSPSGFEEFFSESQAVFEQGGEPDMQKLIGIAAKRNIFFPTLVPEFASQQGKATLPPAIVQPEDGKVLHAFGEEVTFLLGAEHTGAKFAMFTELTPPGGGPPPHWHEHEDEWFLVLEGTVSFYIDGQWHEANPGDAVLAPRKQVHTFKNNTSSPTKMLVHATSDNFERFITAAAAEFARPEGPDMGRAVQIAEEHGIHFVEP
ncbi:MAG: cupin domain-containing protein [Verrucomicrobiaceae bacterium]|nr:cupin domain-containing protein [Verrucomicrobiaceae bacterium]